ncbi:MAG: hypothetical protein WB767_02675 [Nocardioides sp.]
MTDRLPDSPENPHAGQGTVLLDIGGDIGAVVVTMPDTMIGHEVDIVEVGSDLSVSDDHDHDHDHGHGHGHGHGPGDRPHVAVVRRPMPGGGEIPALVYPEVTEGSYWLLPKGTDEIVMTVDVVGGQVTAVTWPS